MDRLLDQMIEEAERHRDLARLVVDRLGDEYGIGTDVLRQVIVCEALRRFKDQGGLNDPFSLPAIQEQK